MVGHLWQSIYGRVSMAGRRWHGIYDSVSMAEYLWLGIIFFPCHSTTLRVDEPSSKL